MALELSDPNQPYSCSAWSGQFSSSEPLIVHGPSPYYDWWGMFENQYVPANAFIDHNMKLHYKTNSLGSYVANLRIEEMLEDCGECYIEGIAQEFGREDCCEVFGGTYHGYDENLDYDEIYCEGSDAVWSSLCFCSGTIDTDGDGIADECDDCSNMSGDINDDMTIDILDIVSVVNIILNGGINSDNYTDCELSDANYNGDSIINVLDIIQIINQVLGNNNRLVTSDLVSVNSLVDNQDLIINLNSDDNIVGMQLSFYSEHHLDVRIDRITSDIMTSNNENFNNVIYNGIQNFVAFSLTNVPFSNDLKITIKDGSYLKYEDLEIVLSNSNGEELQVLWEDDNKYNVNSFSLSNIFPNPFNPSTEISYSVLNSGNINVKIFNLMGQEIAELYNGFQSVGDYRLLWNAENTASGVYFIQMFHSDGQVEKLKAILLK